MKVPLFAYSTHYLGDGYCVDNITERESLLAHNNFTTFLFKLNTSFYDDYRGELILELETKNKEKCYFTFYNKEAMGWFLEDMEVRNFNELHTLEGKRNLEGITSRKDMLWISAYDSTGKYEDFYDELDYLIKKDLNNPIRVRKIKENFNKESLNAQRLLFEMKNGLLRKFNLDELIKAKEKLEYSIDKGIYLLSECTELMNDNNFSFPDFEKYIDYVNNSLTELENEIRVRFD